MKKYRCTNCNLYTIKVDREIHGDNIVVDCFHCNTRIVQPEPYYHTGTYEAINVIEAWGLNFSLGNVIKYVARAGRKTDNPIEDLEKAKWYIEREIEKLKQK
jgi:hypothetical protein